MPAVNSRRNPYKRQYPVRARKLEDSKHRNYCIQHTVVIALWDVFKLTPPPGSYWSFPQTRTISVYMLWLESARPGSVEMRIKTHHPRAARDVDPRYTFSFMIHVLERRGIRSVTAARNRQARLRCVDQHSCGSGYFAPRPPTHTHRRRACSSGLGLALWESLPT
jgi:hypothetical protein